MKIFAFQGFRYSSEVTDRGALAAPPFDQIEDRLRDELHALSPHHYSHFTRPVERDGMDAYAAAAAVHDSWVREGVVQREESPSLYPYVVEAPDGTRRVSLCCLVAVGTTEKSDLRPHELTVQKPLADRLALLRTTRIDPEPVMILAEDDGSFEAQLWADLDGRAPLVSHRDSSGNVHHLFKLDDKDAIQRYKKTLQDRAATIADGHHRCKTAQLYAQEIGASEGTPATAKLAVLISLASPDLAIDPIHRAVTAALNRDSLAESAVECNLFHGAAGAQLAAAVAGAEGPALGVWVRGSQAEVWRLDPSLAPESAPRRARRLSAVLLHHLLLPAAGLELSTATDGTVVYRSDADQLYRMRERDEVGTAFWLPPMAPAAFAEAVSEGDVLPPKSTRFMPKLASGLVWVGHDAKLI